MPKIIDSQALGMLNRALGLTGRGSAETELMDASVVQTLDVASTIRRARTYAATTGIYAALLENDHAAPGSLSNDIDPYAPAADVVQAPYPTPLPEGMDLWILGAGVLLAGGVAADFGSAGLSLTLEPAALAWARDNAGNPVTPTGTRVLLDYWDSMVVQTNSFGLQAGAVRPRTTGLRIRRGSDLRFSSTSTGIVTIWLQLLLGVFPVGLGQDVMG